MKSLKFLAVAYFSLLSWSQGQTIWDESVDGDLSDAYLTPNFFALSFGEQSLFGTVTAQGVRDRDLFTIEVPAGGELTAFRILNYASSDPDNISFVGMQLGSTLSQAPSNNFDDAIGYALFGIDDVGKDLLPIITGNPFTPPFNGLNPLPAGEYAVWVNETATTANYGFEFDVAEVSPVPEPSTAFLGVIGAWILANRRKRK